MSEIEQTKAALLDQVKDVVDRQIRQMLQADGGDIEIVDLTPQNVVQVRLVGACANCMGAAMTLSGAVEYRIMELVPEVKGVEQVP